MEQKEMQGVIQKMLAEGMLWPKITKHFAEKGCVSSRGTAYSAGSLGIIGRYGSTTAPRGNGPRAASASRAAPTKRQYKARRKVRGAAHERTMNNLMRTVLALTGVDRDTKLALVQLVAEL